MDENTNKKKNILMYIMFIAIISVLVVAIIYQFVCIKQLQAQLSDQEGAAIIQVVNKTINIL